MSRRIDNPWRRTAPLAMAHRGQRATFPEQTLEAYEEAIRLGADGIETDVQRTRDGRLVMLHDLTVDRTTNGHGPIAAMDWAEVRALDAGAWRGERFVGARVPSLEDTIELIVGAGILLCVEIKGTPDEAPATAVSAARQRPPPAHHRHTRDTTGLPPASEERRGEKVGTHVAR
jgi:glycerophosphoryl diester phosphodiesterase